MRLVDVDPYDEGHLETLARLLEGARVVDDPESFVEHVEDLANNVRYGGDLEPGRYTLLLDDGAGGGGAGAGRGGAGAGRGGAGAGGGGAGEDGGEAVGFLCIDAPAHDNRDLVMAGLSVLPEHRGRGHGTFLLEEILRRTRALGRSLVWIGIPADDDASAAFLGAHGFASASTDARRHQVLADVDAAEVDRLEAQAAEHGGDYDLERLGPPYDDALLADLVAVTNAINDAPMGTLTFEDEVYDLDRMRTAERARSLRGERFRRVVARHRSTGEIAGHTYLTVRPWAPQEAFQRDTAVARDHRGHRLGLALKIAMMRWLAETEPQLEVVATWNNAANDPMISVNEALGYRLSRLFAMYQLHLGPTSDEAVGLPG